MPSHTHSDAGHSHQIPGGNFGGQGGYTANDTATPRFYTSTGYANIQAAGGGGSHNNMQPFVVVNFVIKT